MDETITEIRSAISRCTPGLKRTAGLRARILSGRAGRRSLCFAPGLRLAGLLDKDVPTDAGEHLLAALREGLSNTARHASATRQR